jgi:hypothetical protein
MKLNSEEEVILRRYMTIVNKIVETYVPSTVPGTFKYHQMIRYLDLSNKLKAILNPPPVKGKLRQIDLEEQINEEKSKGKYNNEL